MEIFLDEELQMLQTIMGILALLRGPRRYLEIQGCLHRPRHRIPLEWEEFAVMAPRPPSAALLLELIVTG
jgi:hypothetical protein